MANKATSALPPAAAHDGTELFPTLQGGHSRKSTGDQIIERAARKDANLSDLTDLDAARTNLDVYSKSETYSQAEVDAKVVGLLDPKGVLDASTEPDYPAALKGDLYVISVAGKVGGAAGVSVQVGDSMFATADSAAGDHAPVGANWASLERNPAGDPLLSLNNLSDLDDPEASRANLDLMECFPVAMSDETTAITVGDGKIIFHCPYDGDLLDVFIGLSTVSSSGAVTVDIELAGVSVFDTLPSIEVGEETSLTGTQAVMDGAAPVPVTKGQKFSLNIDAAGTGAKGLKAYFYIRR